MPKLSIIVNFYNMQREAARTLFSLTPDYQQNISANEYEVIAIDNGSDSPLREEWVKSFGSNFSYLYFHPDHPSPCAAINYVAKNLAKGEFVCICIDGARILSPRTVYFMLAGFRAFPQSFIYTIGMHIGKKVQNELVKEGWDQRKEDKLIATVNWKEDGYRLFGISSFALASRRGVFGRIGESNCFALNKERFIAMEGYNENFTSPGGGRCNHDIFNRLHKQEDLVPIRLLGEATFHQFHGGVSTNVPMNKQHPLWVTFEGEYDEVTNEAPLTYRPPIFLGTHKQQKN